MTKGKAIRGGFTALTALSLTLAPAYAAQTAAKPAKKPTANATLVTGSFTPAVTDPRLAAAIGNRGTVGGSFSFTPSSSGNRNKKVQVAVRARASTPAAARRGAVEPTQTTLSALNPTAYNLGVAIGWKSFALSGDIGKINGGLLPLDRESAEVGLSFSPSQRITTRLKVAAERSEEGTLQLVPLERAYSLDVGGSYSITRNVDLTGGVRYKIQHDRLQSLAERRDSQAVYIGTAFRF